MNTRALPAVGDTAPAIQLLDDTGNSQDLAAQRGRSVVQLASVNLPPKIACVSARQGTDGSG